MKSARIRCVAEFNDDEVIHLIPAQASQPGYLAFQRDFIMDQIRPASGVIILVSYKNRKRKGTGAPLSGPVNLKIIDAVGGHFFSNSNRSSTLRG